MWLPARFQGVSSGRRRAASGFPSELTGLLAWYSADTGVTESGGNVSQWNDQSGNGYHMTQGTSGLRPDYSATGFNGTHGITFVGSTDYLSVASVAHGGGDTFSIFFVGTKDTANANFRVITYHNLTGDDYLSSSSHVMLDTAAGDGVAAIRGGAFQDSQAISTATNYRIGSIYDGSAHTIYVNNVGSGSPASVSGNFATSGTLFLNGGYIGGTVGFGLGMTFAEIVITNTALDATERDNLDDYFTAKWGL